MKVPMMDYPENEGHHPIEPTQPVTPFYSGSDIPLTHPYPSTGYLDNPYIIAPPPPKKPHKHRFFMVSILVVALMFFGASLFFYLAATHQESVAPVAPTAVPTIPPTPGPTVTPTVHPYTAQDILNEMITHNLRVDGPAYGESLAYFFYGAPYDDVVSIPFQSSAIWGVAGSGSGGYCDSCVGLWVYSSYDVATVVQQKLNTDRSIAEQTPAQGPTPYPVVTHYGRCVANGVSGTPYAAIMQQFCV